MEADDAHLWRGHDAGCAPCAASVPRHSASRITTASIVEPVWRPVARATVTIVGPWRRAMRPLPATFLPTQARAMAPPLWASSPWLASAVPTTLSGSTASLSSLAARAARRPASPTSHHSAAVASRLAAVASRLAAATTLEAVRTAASELLPTEFDAHPDGRVVDAVLCTVKAARRVAAADSPSSSLAFALALTGLDHPESPSQEAATPVWPAAVLAELMHMAVDGSDVALARRLFARAEATGVRNDLAVYSAAMRALQSRAGAPSTALGLDLAAQALPVDWRAIDGALGSPSSELPAPALAEAFALWAEMESRNLRADATMLGRLMVMCTRHHDCVRAVKVFLVARARTAGDAEEGAASTAAVRSFVRPKVLDWDAHFVQRLADHLERAHPGVDGRHRVVTFLLSWIFTQPTDLDHVWQLYGYVLSQYADVDVDRPPWKRSYRLMHHSLLHWLLTNGHTQGAIAVVYGLLNRPLPDGYGQADLSALLHAQRLTSAPPTAAVLLPNLLWTRLLKSVGQARGALPVVCDLVSALVASNAGAVNVLVYNACLGALKAQTAVLLGLEMAHGTRRAPATDQALWAAVTSTMRALQAGLPSVSTRGRALVAEVVREIQVGRDNRVPAMAPAVQLAWSLLGLLVASGQAPSAGSINSATEVALLFGDATSACHLLQLAQRLAVVPTEHTLRVAQRARQAAVAAHDPALAAQLRQCEQAMRPAAGASAPPPHSHHHHEQDNDSGSTPTIAAPSASPWTLQSAAAAVQQHAVVAASVYERSAWAARLLRWLDTALPRPSVVW